MEQITPTMAGLVVALLGNITAIAWGAATLHTTVRQLRDTTRQLAANSERQWRAITSHDRRLAVLEDRAGRIVDGG